MQRRSEDENDRMEVSAETPLGKLAAKGFRVSDIISLLTLLGVAGILFFGWMIVQLLGQHNLDSNAAQNKFANALRESAQAQRMNTCILSLPQEKREQEYMQANGFCRQMAQLLAP